jgi:MoaA/NifB/PqqE/SkfB family radical SAM enzyme
MEKLDLTQEVTVFVITTTTPDLPVCLEALRNQDCLFRQELIENVSPMSAAFQCMIDRCQTPYFVQCDEDMKLNPNAIRKLHTHLSSSPSNVGFFFLSLRDTDMNYPLVGIKIYRHAVYRTIPFVNSFSCETDQNARLKSLGFIIDGIWREYMGDHVVGEHGIFWTPFQLFDRYKRLAQKARLNPSQLGSWLSWVQKFAVRFAKYPTQRHLAAWLGWVVGLTSDLSKCTSEKDFHTYGQDEDWLMLQKYLTLPDGPMRPVLETPFDCPDGPKELNVYLTSACNFACPWCRRQTAPDSLDPTIPDVSAEFVHNLVGKWPSLASCCIAGFGEPLLSDQLVPVVKKAKARGLYTSLITNGSLIMQRADNLQDLPLDAISISLNAANAPEHERKTGTKTWGDVIEGILWLRSIGREVMLSFVLTRQDLPKIGEYLDLAARLDCKVDLLSVLPHGTSQEEFFKIALLSDCAEVPMWIESAKKHKEAGRVRTWPTLIRKDLGTCPGSCNSPFVSIGVDGLGSLTGCRRISPPVFSNGQFWQESALQNDAITRLQGQFANRDWPDLCRLCFGNWQK